jgi:DNA-binding transcriptional LysR family regulator
MPTFACDAEHADGRVVEAFADTMATTGKGYWLVDPERRANLPALQAFRSWLLALHGRTPG